jgi:hypothetical protein
MLALTKDADLFPARATDEPARSGWAMTFS